MQKQTSRSWGACFYDHYVRFLREPVERRIYRKSDSDPAIQLLEYEKVFQGCRMFSSLGLSHYEDELGGVAEVCAVIDSEYETIPSLLANALFFLINNRMEIGWGMAVGGIDRIAPQFYLKYRKVAWYLTRPVNLPPAFHAVSCEGEQGRVFMAFLISDSEYEYFKDKGAEQFEKRLAEGNVDPFELNRPSII